METEETIGDRIKKIRRIRNLTLKQLGAMMGIADSSITVWEKNYNVPSLKMLILLCKALQVSSDTLIFGKDMIVEPETSSIDTTTCKSHTCNIIIQSLNEKLLLKDEQILLLKKINNMLEKNDNKI